MRSFSEYWSAGGVRRAVFSPFSASSSLASTALWPKATSACPPKWRVVNLVAQAQPILNLYSLK